MGDLYAEEQDLFNYVFEEDPPTRSAMRTVRLDMVKSHVTDQGGSAEMAHIPLMKSDGRISCKTIFWWYTMYQIKTNKEKVEYYPTDGSLTWANYSIDWTEHLKQAIGPNGDVTEEGLKKIFNGNIRNIPAKMLKDAETKIRGIREGWKTSHPPGSGKLRPGLGIAEVKMAICGCCFSNAELYNEHMKSIHGIEASLKEDFPSAPPPPSAPQGLYPHLDALNAQSTLPDLRHGSPHPHGQSNQVQPGQLYLPGPDEAQTREARGHRGQGRPHHSTDKLWKI